MMYPVYVKLFDAFLNLLGAIGMYPVIRKYFGQTQLNPLEKQIRWIFLTVFSLFCLRVLHLGLWPTTFSKNLIFFLSMGIVFTVFLYCETLLRRHFPIKLKYFALAGFVFFLIGCFAGLSSEIWFTQVFFIYIVILQVFTLVLLIFRNRADYSRMENTLINRNIIAMIFIPPFFITDLIIFNYTGLPKMGVLGGLLIAYISLYQEGLFREKAVGLRNLFMILGGTAALAFCVMVLARTEDPYFFPRIWLLFVCLHLTVHIYLTTKQLNGDDDVSKFLYSVIDTDKKSLLAFLRGVNSAFTQIDKKFLRSVDFKQYNEESFQDIFEKCRTHVLSIFDIQALIHIGPSEDMDNKDLEKLDKLKDILEKNEMTYACQIGVKQTYYILFNVPAMGYDATIRLRTKLMTDIAELTER